MAKGFRFEAYATLSKNLGKYDAIVELNELAARGFIDRIRDNPASRIKEESDKYGIRVDYDNGLSEKFFAARRAQFYILSVYQQAEQFIDELLADLPEGKQWQTAVPRGKHEPQLEWFLRMIKDKTTTALPEYFDDLVALFNYYRLVRNAFMHEGDTTRQLNRQRDGIDRRVSDMKNKPVSKPQPKILLSLPNAYNDLGFDDFVLFTRVVKELALSLCNALKPSLDDLITKSFSASSHFGLRQYVGNDKRFATACETLLQRKFNLDKVDVQYYIPVIQKLIDR